MHWPSFFAGLLTLPILLLLPLVVGIATGKLRMFRSDEGGIVITDEPDEDN